MGWVGVGNIGVGTGGGDVGQMGGPYIGGPSHTLIHLNQRQE